MSLSRAEVEAFFKAYDRAVATKDFAKVGGFIAPDALFRFSDGDYEGVECIQTAFEWIWNSAEGDKYTLSSVHIAHLDEASAAVTYDFTWSGVTDGRPWAASGRGTAVIVKRDGKLQILIEHLSRKGG